MNRVLTQKSVLLPAVNMPIQSHPTHEPKANNTSTIGEGFLCKEPEGTSKGKTNRKPGMSRQSHNRTLVLFGIMNMDVPGGTGRLAEGFLTAINYFRRGAEGKGWKGVTHRNKR